MKYLLKELFSLNSKPDFSEALFEHLFYLNFNSYHFLLFATAKIRSEVETLPSMTAQLEHLSLTLKKLNQAQVKPSFGLKPLRESLKNLLSNWLEEEIHFIEKKRQLTLIIPPWRGQGRKRKWFQSKDYPVSPAACLFCPFVKRHRHHYQREQIRAYPFLF